MAIDFFGTTTQSERMYELRLREYDRQAVTRVRFDRLLDSMRNARIEIADAYARGMARAAALRELRERAERGVVKLGDFSEPEAYHRFGMRTVRFGRLPPPKFSTYQGEH